MGIQVEFISKELIKPSSPTPHHLSKLHFSSIDQDQCIISIPIVLFYEKSNNFTNLQISNLLKQSLSNTLTIFYPLAGRFNNHSYADCNDEGALFIETKANCQLSDILRNRNQFHNHSKKFIPLQPEKRIHQYGSLFQITYFICGALVISFAMPHTLADGYSQFMFLNSWAAIARGHTVEIPSFGTASIFQPRKISGFEDIPPHWVFKENAVTKSFVFDAFTLSALSDKYSYNNHEKLSRVQALNVFIFRRIIATISKAKEADNNSQLIVFNAVNVLPLIDLPNSKQCFGNRLVGAPAVIEIGKEDEIPKRIKDSIKNMNADSIKKLVSQSGDLNFWNELLSTDWLISSSLCNFPIYEVDFGWGKPEWIAGNGMGFDKLIHFVDTKQGRGIEAWISLPEEDMAKFEKDKHLLSHLSSTPNGNPNLNSCL